MKKRFIVAIDAATSDQNEAFKARMVEKGLGWWHWLRNLWLFVDYRGIVTAAEIRDIVNELFEGRNCMVFELTADGDTWSGFGPGKEPRNMFKWIHDYWKRQ